MEKQGGVVGSAKPATVDHPVANSRASDLLHERERSLSGAGVALGTLTLVGAGEFMPAMSRAHRAALARLTDAPRAVFLDTPAGFETNVDTICAKATDYYTRRLHTELRIASYRHAERTSAADAARAVAAIRAANFILVGPGSPSYALEQWRGSPVWEAVVERVRGGAHLLAASAAAITLGRYSLPVYEIYKVGRDPFWLEGLNLLGELGLDLAVVPHFDDNSGGEHYDSRFCYMGLARFEALQAQLPPEVTIVGIDEYTTLALDPLSDSATVGGQGVVTVIADGERSVWPAGAAIPFARLRARGARSAPAIPPRDASDEQAALPEPDALEALGRYLESLSEMSSAERVELLSRVEAATRSAESARTPSNDDALVDLVLALRDGLRGAKRWDLSDLARDRLAALGYRIADAPQWSSWSRD